MDKFKHENIISQFEYGKDTYVKDSGKSKEVNYIILELALGGELFDFIAHTGAFSENLARYFFKQFLAGLDHCHSQGFAHRDLKPENLLLDANFNLKLADFGFAGPVEGRDGSGYLKTKLGTLNYMSPEIHLKQPYLPKSIDLFAASIILFIMVAQHPPFTTAQPNDPFYRCIAANRADIFWKTHCKNKKGGEAFFSEEFKQLIETMLQLDPVHRPSMAEVLHHKWMQGPMPTTEEVQAEFFHRNQLVQKNMEEERAQKQMEKEQRMNTRPGGGRYRSLKLQVNEEEAKEGEDLKIDSTTPDKKMDTYVAGLYNNTEFFSTCHPEMIEEETLKYLRENEKVEPTINPDKYKIKFALVSKALDEQEETTSITMKISRVDSETVCVEFKKTSGDQMNFLNHFNKYRTQVLEFANDAAVPQTA